MAFLMESILHGFLIGSTLVTLLAVAFWCGYKAKTAQEPGVFVISRSILNDIPFPPFRTCINTYACDIFCENGWINITWSINKDIASVKKMNKAEAEAWIKKLQQQYPKESYSLIEIPKSI